MGAGIIDDDRGLKYLGESLIATSRYSYNTRDLRLDCEIWSRVDDIKEIEDYLHYASFLFRPEKGVLFENPIWGGIEYVFDLFPVITGKINFSGGQNAFIVRFSTGSTP